MAELRKLRKLRLLTMRGLADRSGVSPNTIWRMEHGKGAHPATIEKLAKALEVEPQRLVKID